MTDTPSTPTIVSPSHADLVSPKALYAVIWQSHGAPPVTLNYLWTVGMSPSAEEALTRAEGEAFDKGEEWRNFSDSDPQAEPRVLLPKPLRRGQPSWGIMWKSHNPGGDTRYLLFREPQPSPESALEVAKAELVALATTYPTLAPLWFNGTFYPVRLDLKLVGQKGTFYPVLVTAGVEVYEDPTRAKITMDVKGK